MELLTQDVGGESLKPCGNFSHAARGVGFDKQMNVLGHYFQRMNRYSNLLRLEPQQRLKSFVRHSTGPVRTGRRYFGHQTR